MFEGILKSKFFLKCKSNVKTTMKRIEMVKRKRVAVQKYMKGDIIELLEKGFESNAFDRVEGLMMEMRRADCYDLIDNFCSHILTHLEAMSKQKDCPENCREAVSSLSYAAARVADLPELKDLRSLFSERYGNSLDAFVNKQLMEKLSSGVPSKDLQLKFMRELTNACGLHSSKASHQEKPTVRQEESIPETAQKRSLEEQGASGTDHFNSTVTKGRFIPPPYVKSVRTRNDVDREEEMLDEVLEYYSKRRADGGQGKTTSRASSLPTITDPALDSGRSAYGRAASFQHEERKGHVHPKLPDYDELVARLERLRGLRDPGC